MAENTNNNSEVDEKTLWRDVVLYIYQYSVDGSERTETDDYEIGRTLTTHKYYVRFKTKLVNFTFPKIPFLTHVLIDENYIIDLDLKAHDALEDDIIRHPGLNDAEKLLLLSGLLNKEIAERVPDTVKEKYQTPYRVQNS